MTVAELIEKLQTKDQNLVVKVETETDFPPLICLVELELDEGKALIVSGDPGWFDNENFK